MKELASRLWVGEDAGEGGMGFGDRFKETEQKRRGKDTSSWGVM